MVPNFLKYALTLQAELLSMVAEEIHHKAEDFVRQNSDDGYEAYLAQLVDNIERTVDTLATPFEPVIQGMNKLQQDLNLGTPATLSETLDRLTEHVRGLRKKSAES
jgi:non-homologous end joining protein Ku